MNKLSIYQDLPELKQEAEPGKQHVELEGNIARAAAKEVEYGMNNPFVNEGTVNTFITIFIAVETQ